MKATKYTLTVTVEALHMDSIPDMLRRVYEQLQQEAHAGCLRMEDGDEVLWATKQKLVEF